ncbi:MAG: hypothetical protein Q8S55_23765 [Methylococcaceae bacterium]|nr:hypothetical protein [Methylococcaceae bacterium]
MTLAQIKLFNAAVQKINMEQAGIALFVARAAQADEDGYKAAVELLG